MLTVLYNLSQNLGLANRYEEALEIVRDGEAMCLRHGSLRMLAPFAINHGCDLLELGRKKEALPYLAMSYYGSKIFNNTYNLRAVSEYVKERFDLEFD